MNFLTIIKILMAIAGFFASHMVASRYELYDHLFWPAVGVLTVCYLLANMRGNVPALPGKRR